MSNTDSSAIVRLVQIVQQEPIMDTARPFETGKAGDTVPTELIDMDRPRRSGWRRYFLTGALAVGLGVGAAFYLVDQGGTTAASARSGLPGATTSQPAAAQPNPTIVPPTVSEPTAPVVETIAAPAVVEPIPAVAVVTPEPAIADSVSEPIAAVEESPPAAPEPALATPAVPAKSVQKKTSRQATRSKTRTATKTGAMGTLMVGAKPPCRIIIDGRDTGLTTPQRAIELSEGKHSLELVNSDHGIKSRASVVIKAGSSTKVIKDLSDRI